MTAKSSLATHTHDPTVHPYQPSGLLTPFPLGCLSSHVRLARQSFGRAVSTVLRNGLASLLSAHRLNPVLRSIPSTTGGSAHAQFLFAEMPAPFARDANDDC